LGVTFYPFLKTWAKSQVKNKPEKLTKETIKETAKEIIFFNQFNIYGKGEPSLYAFEWI